MDVAIRDAMVPQAGTPGFFEGVRNLGVSAVEIELAADLTTPHARRADGTPFGLASPAGADEFADALRSAGLRACAFLLATDFTTSDAAAHVKWAGDATALAASLGVSVIRIDPLARDKTVPRDTTLARFAVNARRLLDRQPSVAVDLGVENHGPFANDPSYLDAVLDAVDDPRVGLTLDTGNFYWFGVPLGELYGLIERYAPRVKHTHVKNINYPPEMASAKREVGVGYKEYCCSLDEGNIDLARVARILRGAGYDRHLCIENESLFKHAATQRADVLRRDVAAVRAAIRSA